ncbi:3',5'-cyclic-AMP phosphodiesterase [Gallaecimonas kandeliae]|uniref:3',5'-cyclic-AMP phosphodiesterase n=1 Tax=Gallaecimonas kandeliae TaxID=3029055 RepID=UPI002649A436|nr:3',5'-cyclic-AMP phosphodiesterase [Gallaecimonas kandeliae]WKE64740.1 3',5'-cyclic-AMP phosphodiesterase [Gallaecimonas kandeliae]
MLTDPHLFQDHRHALLGVPTWQSMQAVESALDVDTDAWLLTGDLAQDHKVETYRQLAEHLTGKPWFWLPGNHDDPAAMEAALGAPVKRLLGKHWQVLLLSSHDPGKVSGWLGAEELALIDSYADADLHTLVAVHHHPVPCGSYWLDHHQLKNGDELLSRLGRHKKSKAVLFGHIHQELDRMEGDIRLLASPSTCVQFAPQSQDFALDGQGPGGRYLALLPDGNIETRVLRLAPEHFPADIEAGGY